MTVHNRVESHMYLLNLNTCLKLVKGKIYGPTAPKYNKLGILLKTILSFDTTLVMYQVKLSLTQNWTMHLSHSFCQET